MSTNERAFATEDVPPDAFIIIPESTAWGCSGLSARDFRELVEALVSSGVIVRSRRDLVFANLEAAALILGRIPGTRRARR